MSVIALTQLQALGQSTRLDLFRALIRAEPDGLPVGELAERVGIKPNTASMNLHRLLTADLVACHREGKIIRYRVKFSGIEHLVSYLLEDCCAGNPALCATIRSQLDQAC